GVRVGAGGDRATVDDPTGLSRSTEHRSWLRRLVPGYHIYLPVRFTVTIVGKTRKQRHVSGSSEVVVSREGALEMGIPEDVLARAVAAQKAKAPAGRPKTSVPPPEPPAVLTGVTDLGEGLTARPGRAGPVPFRATAAAPPR